MNPTKSDVHGEAATDHAFLADCQAAKDDREVQAILAEHMPWFRKQLQEQSRQLSATSQAGNAPWLSYLMSLEHAEGVH